MSEIKERPAHQQRVIAERLDLAYKVDRLSAFMAGATFVTLPFEERHLLRQQLKAMSDYLSCLNSRIANFDKETP